MATRFSPSGGVPREASPYAMEFIEREFERIFAILNTLSAASSSGGGSSSSGAPVDAEYLVGAANATLTAERVVQPSATPTATTAWDLTTPGEAKLEVTVIAGGTPVTPHDLLSATHPDTEPDAPEVGDLIIGSPASDLDASLFWFGGLPLDGIPSSLDAGTNAYWSEGLPNGGLGLFFGTAKWQRLPLGLPGATLKATASGVAWEAGVSSGSGASVYRATNFVPTYATNTPVPLSNSQFDTGGYWSALLPDRFVIPAGAAGKYLVIGQITWEDSGFAGDLDVFLLVNGAVVAGQAGFGAPSDDRPQQCSKILDLIVGDYVQVAAYYLTGSPTSTQLLGGSGNTFLQLLKLG